MSCHDTRRSSQVTRPLAAAVLVACSLVLGDEPIAVEWALFDLGAEIGDRLRPAVPASAPRANEYTARRPGVLTHPAVAHGGWYVRTGSGSPLQSQLRG